MSENIQSVCRGEKKMRSCRYILFVLLFVFVPLTLFGQSIVEVLDAPGPESRGLAWDGQYLWCADSDDDMIYKLDPQTGEAMDALLFTISGTGGGGITWSGDGAVWVTRGSFFHKIDAVSGGEVTSFHCPGG
jgi:streptogramin lyase